MAETWVGGPLSVPRNRPTAARRRQSIVREWQSRSKLLPRFECIPLRRDAEEPLFFLAVCGDQDCLKHWLLREPVEHRIEALGAGSKRDVCAILVLTE